MRSNFPVRLRNRRVDVSLVTVGFDVPFDDLRAERDIRSVELSQTNSGSWRTLRGARDSCAIRTYGSTRRKCDHAMFNGICQLFDDRSRPAGAGIVTNPQRLLRRRTGAKRTADQATRAIGQSGASPLSPSLGRLCDA